MPSSTREKMSRPTSSVPSRKPPCPGARNGSPGVADAEWGHVVCAWIVPRPGVAPSLEEVRRACAGRLARHKLPRRLVLVDALPRTTSGKLQRRALVASLRERLPTV